MFGRAAKAIGRAFGRKEVAAEAPAPRRAAPGDNPPPSHAAGRQHADAQRPRKGTAATRGRAPAPVAQEPAKHGGRKPKGKS
ncbi:UNVERIFIED_ORG: hypothetical protein RHOFW104R5_15250 [Rhodanobacter sp. FW104-R5]